MPSTPAITTNATFILQVFIDYIRHPQEVGKNIFFNTKFQPLQKNLLLFAGTWLFCNLLLHQKIYAQVYGCTDPLANNYNPLATLNDGSCTYNSINYSPAVKVDPLNNILAESSGLQMAGNFLWSFNDGGGAAAIYRIDTLTNALLQTVYLSGATNIDWEDMAFDGTYFYIGDFGNNANGARTDLKIYKFPLSAIPTYETSPVFTISSAQIAVIQFTYSDQPQPPQPTSANNTKFDCEAMLVDDGNIHLFTKNWVDQNTTHYIIHSTMAGSFVALPVETLQTNYLVTAADKPPGQNLVALLGYKTSGSYAHFMHLLTGYANGLYFSGNKRQLNLPGVLQMGQAEGLCFRNNRYGYISNEKVSSAVTVNQKLQAFDVGSFVSEITSTYIFNGNGNWNDAANWVFQMIPPTVLGRGSEIVIDPVPGGQCVQNVAQTLSAGATLTVRHGVLFVQGNLISQ